MRVFDPQRVEGKKILEDASREKQEGVQGQWQQESLFREVPEQVRGNADTHCGNQTMRRAYIAMKHGKWESFKEEYRKEKKLCEWTFERIREAYETVAMGDDTGRLGTAQEILRKSTDFLRRIIEPEDGMGGVTLSNVCPHCFPLNDYIWRVSTGHGRRQQQKGRALQLVVRGSRPIRVESQTGFWWYRSVSTPMKRRC